MKNVEKDCYTWNLYSFPVILADVTRTVEKAKVYCKLSLFLEKYFIVWVMWVAWVCGFMGSVGQILERKTWVAWAHGILARVKKSMADMGP